MEAGKVVCGGVFEYSPFRLTIWISIFLLGIKGQCRHSAFYTAKEAQEILCPAPAYAGNSQARN